MNTTIIEDAGGKARWRRKRMDLGVTQTRGGGSRRRGSMAAALAGRVALSKSAALSAARGNRIASYSFYR